MNTINNSQVEEHRVRTPEVHKEPHAEFASHPETLIEHAQGLPSSTLVLHAGLGRRGNAPVRATAMQSAQRAHGNRAVQRCVQRGRGFAPAHSGALTTSVQRFQGPDSDWWKMTGAHGMMGTYNSVAALPVIGNALSGISAGGALTASTIAGLMGEEEQAKKLRGNAAYFGMHAIPGIGNAMAAQHAGQDWGAFGENLAGRQAPGSVERWNSDTLPHMGTFLDSLF